ncbi:MAG: nucleotidyltransferase [Acidobacteriia bacterium]|nr:nucleotidyltransferase [Terriglobia bacterium]
MGGSRRRFFDRETKPEDVLKAIRAEEEKAKDQAFDTEVSETLGDLLADYNARDTEAVSAALQRVKSALESEIEGTVAPIFGGSVRKHTYVDGLSDVDALVILKDAELSRLTPQQVLDYFEQKLRTALSNWKVSRGQLAVTVAQEDLQLQLLPAVREDQGLRIASAKGDSWSKINPQPFFDHLTRVNDRGGGKVIPTIKLVKVINETLSEATRLTGYHIESLAIEAFRDYGGPKNSKAMLVHFFDTSRTRVLNPIKDKTGQSVYVDEYLGPANSQARKMAAEALDRVLRRMKNADASRSKPQWLQILGEE